MYKALLTIQRKNCVYELKAKKKLVVDFITYTSHKTITVKMKNTILLKNK